MKNAQIFERFLISGVCLKISERNSLGEAGGIPPTPPSARRICPFLAEKRPFRIEKLPKNLKKYQLELHFGPKAGLPRF